MSNYFLILGFVKGVQLYGDAKAWERACVAIWALSRVPLSMFSLVLYNGEMAVGTTAATFTCLFCEGVIIEIK